MSDSTQTESDDSPEVIYERIMERKPMTPEDPPASYLWLITFTDVMALMLTFFVLLYSMSVPVEEDWDEMTNAISRQFQREFSPQWYSATQDTISIEKLDFTEALNLGYLRSVIADIISEDQTLKNVKLIPQTDHLIVSLPQDLLFESGRAEVSPQGKQALFKLGGVMARIKNRIEISGHADPRPPTGETFLNNWELSLARATQVAFILRNAGYKREIDVHGLSSARYDELEGEMTEDERLAFARRVDIIIMKDDGALRTLMGIE